MNSNTKRRTAKSKIIFNPLLGYVIAATGTLKTDDQDPTTEVIDLNNKGSACRNLTDISARRASSGGLIRNQPLICGGVGDELESPG